MAMTRPQPLADHTSIIKRTAENFPKTALASIQLMCLIAKTNQVSYHFLICLIHITIFVNFAFSKLFGLILILFFTKKALFLGFKVYIIISETLALLISLLRFWKKELLSLYHINFPFYPDITWSFFSSENLMDKIVRYCSRV